MQSENSFVSGVKNFLNELECPFEELESKDRTVILQLNETTSIHLLPLISANKVLYTSNLFCFSMSNYFLKHDSHLIHLWEDQWIHSQDKVKSRFYSLLGKTKRIHARETEVQKIEMPMAEEFLIKNHLNESTKAKHKYGLFKGDELVSVITLGSKVKFNSRKFSWEIIRYCNANGTTVVGGLSKLLKAFKDEYNPGHLMTYVDRDWSTGRGFEAQGFEMQEVTEPNWYWLSLKEKKRYFPNRINESIPKSDSENWIKIYNSGSYKYTWEN